MSRRSSSARRPAFALRIAVVAALAMAVVALVVLTLTRDTSAGGEGADYEATWGGGKSEYVAGSVFVGDSWVGGSDMGGNGPDNFARLVADHYRWTMDPKAIGGTGYLTGTTFGDPGRIGSVTEAGPEVTVIFNGINDLDPAKHDNALGDLPAAAGQAYDAYLAALPNSQLVVVGYVAPGGSAQIHRDANAILAEAAAARGITFIDPTTWFDGENQQYIGEDRFHLTDEGHQVLADLMIAQLDALGAADWRETDPA